jgi:hypothetical protein
VTHPHGHLDLDGLADVLAGEGDEAHVRSCAACADALAELAAADASVTAALAALPEVPLPPGLSLRLTRALQEERRREVAAVRPQRRRAPTWLPAAAASAVLVMAGAAGWSLLGPPLQEGSDQAASGTSADSGRGPEGGADGDGGGGAGGRAEDSATQPEAAAEMALPRPSALPTATTPTDWADAAARSSALSRLLDQAGAAGPAPPASTAADGLARLRDPAALAGCIAALPAGGDVLAVDYALYAGAPAVAVVQPGRPGLVQVTVVGSGCSAADPQVLDRTVLRSP